MMEQNIGRNRMRTNNPFFPFQTQATLWVRQLWTQQGASEIRANKPFPFFLLGQINKKEETSQ
jgi:hypothetical protein